jgi:alkyldihydroxyacetonephosphate synthase
VLALVAVLPTGEVLRTRATSLPSMGPDLNQLFIGSEGIFGVITEATLRVFSTPESRTFQTFAFADFPAGFAAVQELAALGVHPAVLDLTEEERQGDASVTLYLVFEGYRQEVEAHQRRASEIYLKHEGTDLGPQGTEEYWRTRHDSAYRYREEVLARPAAERRERRWGRGAWDYLHVTLPASQVVPFYQRCQEHLAPQGIVVREAAVWTEPERFSLILAGDEADEASRERVRRASDWVLHLAQDLGGTMEYCHGVGLKLEHLLERELGVGLEVVRQIKRSLDPNNILNSGKLGV